MKFVIQKIGDYIECIIITFFNQRSHSIEINWMSPIHTSFLTIILHPSALSLIVHK